MTTIKSYYSPKVRISHSKLHGIGVFAIEPITKNEIVSVRIGPIVTLEETKNIENNVGDYNFQLSENLFIAARTNDEREQLGLRVNHGCNPNVGVFGQVCIVAMREINIDEELTIDYVMIEARPSYSFKCECNSKMCRSIISGNDWKIPELQSKYNGYFSHYIQNNLINLIDT